MRVDIYRVSREIFNRVLRNNLPRTFFATLYSKLRRKRAAACFCQNWLTNWIESVLQSVEGRKAGEGSFENVEQDFKGLLKSAAYAK